MTFNEHLKLPVKHAYFDVFRFAETENAESMKVYKLDFPHASGQLLGGTLIKL